ncbi:MAG: (2E,6E)-farnesyl diphosphate synthase [Gammaproteobacteria bacterium]|nr:(2E,6E)-farnesyl diphosphate synthase [Gammaproteobacteria bacterium]NNJ48970.1 (2E,6E)-farnesyl diphosphate synthase [Gammaproteobacteria bacterium]
MPHEFQPRLNTYQDRVNAALDKYLPNDDPPEHNLAEAIRYSVIGGGKRIRPAMVYAAGEAMGVSTDLLDIPACAVEMIHAYSLIHDDLPAMDDDDLRRGRPTCHKAFDEATAMLAGDALQALAYEILAKDDHEELTPDHRIGMLSLLTEASGAHGMAGGQAVDLASVGKQLTLAQLEHMHQLKTGALIRASILLGGMCKQDISEEELKMLSDYALCIGLSFQIQDDILDVIGDTETLGKPQGSDQAQEKPTFPAILGVEESRQRAMQQHELALKILEPLDEKADSLRQLSAYIVERQY